MSNQWFKFYGAEYLSDPKMDRLTAAERSCWLTLLCMASQSEGKVRFLSVDSLLSKSGVHFNPYDTSEWDNSQNVIKNFEMYEMVAVHKNGDIEIKNWSKRQDAALTGYERVKKYRENKKKIGNDNEMITDDNANDNTRIEENRIEENRIDIGNNSLSKPQGEETNEVLTVVDWRSDTALWKSKTLEKLEEQSGSNKYNLFFERELNNFISYWTEKSPNGKKERWQLEKVFDPNRRLGTWIRRAQTFQKLEIQKQEIIKKDKYKIGEV